MEFSLSNEAPFISSNSDINNKDVKVDENFNSNGRNADDNNDISSNNNNDNNDNDNNIDNDNDNKNNGNSNNNSNGNNQINNSNSQNIDMILPVEIEINNSIIPFEEMRLRYFNITTKIPTDVFDINCSMIM